MAQRGRPRVIPIEALRESSLRKEVLTFKHPYDAVSGGSPPRSVLFTIHHRLVPTAAGFDPHPDIMAEPAPKAADVGGELLSTRLRAIIAPRARLEAAGGRGHREIPLHADPRAWSVSKQSVK
jgi:hypothetical protein